MPRTLRTIESREAEKRNREEMLGVTSSSRGAGYLYYKMEQLGGGG